MKIDELQKLMNEYGAKKEPFLFAINYEMTEGLFVLAPLNQSEYLFRTPCGSNCKVEDRDGMQTVMRLTKRPISYEEYLNKLKIIMSALQRGDSFLANLTLKSAIELELADICFDDLSGKNKYAAEKIEDKEHFDLLKYIFQHSNSPYGLLVPDRFVCFSPERFVLIKNGKISTNPMKGTIDADDERAEEKILSDPKETAEHYTVVDLLRNDLGIVAENIKVDKFRYIDNITTQNGIILQVSSEITGELPSDYLSRLGDIIFSILPAGSICGAPKKSTVQAISKAEGEDRGYYTGIFGYFDGNELDSAVLIRYIEQEGDKYFFRSGGGITINSNPDDEYREAIDKIYLPFSSEP